MSSDKTKDHLLNLNALRIKKQIENFPGLVGDRDSNGCMIFKGKESTNKYGTYQITASDGTRIKGAHRVAYYLHNGEIDNKLNVCHSCDNKLCCNPEHLWQGTQKENLQDMSKKGRHVGNLGKKHTKESITKISKASSGKNNAFHGKNHTEETKAKMREAWKIRKGKGEANLVAN